MDPELWPSGHVPELAAVTYTSTSELPVRRTDRWEVGLGGHQAHRSCVLRASALGVPPVPGIATGYVSPEPEALLNECCGQSRVAYSRPRGTRQVVTGREPMLPGETDR